MPMFFKNSSQLKHSSYSHKRNNINDNKGRITKLFAFGIFAGFAATIRDVFNVC